MKLFSHYWPFVLGDAIKQATCQWFVIHCNMMLMCCHCFMSGDESFLGWHWGLFKFNSLAPGEFQYNFRYVIFKEILEVDGWDISCEIALIWMSLDLNDEKSTLVQVMAWCCQATSHCLSQCWTRSLSPYGVTMPQWVKNYFSMYRDSHHDKPVTRPSYIYNENY